MNNVVDSLISQKDVFFRFMKEKYPLYYNSNIFLRDVQYAVKSYFEKKEIALKTYAAEVASREFISYLVSENLLKEIKPNTWRVMFSLEDKTVPVEEPASAGNQPENVA